MPCVNLLWTGGWDSTYRLLDLVLQRDAEVQPYYVIDPDRRSTTMELKTVAAIRFRLAEEFGVVDAIRPFILGAAALLPTNDEFSEAFRTLRSRAFLGSQYVYLARFAVAHDLHDLELCVHVDDKAAAFVTDAVVPVEDEAGSNYALRTGVASELELFRRFRFPVLDLTKREMAARASDHGFADVMEMTWFCHRPVNGAPCGTCGPCRYAVEEGMARRIPLHRRVLYPAAQATFTAKQFVYDLVKGR